MIAPLQMNKQNTDKHRLQTIRHKSDVFNLKATYQYTTNEQNQNLDQRLSILLKVKGTNNFSSYQSLFTNSNLPQQIISTFCGIDIIFQCFRELNSFSVDLNQGKILIKGIFQIKGRKIQKKAFLFLKKQDQNQYQYIFQQIQQLEEQVLALRKNKQQREIEIRKQYERKFEQQKKKFQQMLKKRQEDELKARKKQKQLEQLVLKLKDQIGSVSEKIQSFTKQKLYEIKQLKVKHEQLKTQYNQRNKQYQELILFTKGEKGRKIVKPNQCNLVNAENKSKQNKKISQNTLIQTQQISKQGSGSLNEGQIKKGLAQNFNSLTQSYNKSINYFYDDKSPYIREFDIKQKQITYIGEQERETLLLMKSQIPRDSEYQFQFKIVKAKDRSIMIGVIDKIQAIKQRYSEQQSISYWAKTGYIWGGNKFQGEGYKEGDTVRVKVLLNRPYIEWQVNGKPQASYQPQFFLNQSRPYVPFIQMENKEDSVIWKQIN